MAFNTDINIRVNSAAIDGALAKLANLQKIANEGINVSTSRGVPAPEAVGGVSALRAANELARQFFRDVRTNGSPTLQKSASKNFLEGQIRNLKQQIDVQRGIINTTREAQKAMEKAFPAVSPSQGYGSATLQQSATLLKELDQINRDIIKLNTIYNALPKNTNIGGVGASRANLKGQLDQLVNRKQYLSQVATTLQEYLKLEDQAAKAITSVAGKEDDIASNDAKIKQLTRDIYREQQRMSRLSSRKSRIGSGANISAFAEVPGENPNAYPDKTSIVARGTDTTAKAIRGGRLRTQQEVDTDFGFNVDRLKTPGALQQIAFAQLFGGLPSAAGAAVGAGVGGTTGALLGNVLTQVVLDFIKKPFEAAQAQLEEAKEYGLAFQRSILGITAINQATSQVVGPNGEPTDLRTGLSFQTQRARETQLAARQRLLPLGIAGQTEATFVQGIASALSQRGIEATPEQIAKIAENVGGAIQAQRPQLLDNTTLLLRDIQDVFGGGPLAQRTVLSQLIRPALGGVQSGKTGEDIVRATDALKGFTETAKNLDNPVVLLNKFAGALDNIKTAAGGTFLQTLIPAYKQLFQELSKPEVAEAANKVAKALGEIDALKIRASAGLVDFGEGLVNHVLDPLGKAAPAILGFGAAITALLRIASAAPAVSQIGSAFGANFINSRGLKAGSLTGAAAVGGGLARLLGPLALAGALGYGAYESYQGQQADLAQQNKDLQTKIDTDKLSTTRRTSGLIDATLKRFGLDTEETKYATASQAGPVTQFSQLNKLFQDLQRSKTDEDREELLRRGPFLLSQIANARENASQQAISVSDEATPQRIEDLNDELQLLRDAINLNTKAVEDSNSDKRQKDLEREADLAGRKARVERDTLKEERGGIKSSFNDFLDTTGVGLDALYVKPFRDLGKAFNGGKGLLDILFPTPKIPNLGKLDFRSPEEIKNTQLRLDANTLAQKKAQDAIDKAEQDKKAAPDLIAQQHIDQRINQLKDEEIKELERLTVAIGTLNQSINSISSQTSQGRVSIAAGKLFAAQANQTGDEDLLRLRQAQLANAKSPEEVKYLTARVQALTTKVETQIPTIVQATLDQAVSAAEPFNQYNKSIDKNSVFGQQEALRNSIFGNAAQQNAIIGQINANQSILNNANSTPQQLNTAAQTIVALMEKFSELDTEAAQLERSFDDASRAIEETQSQLNDSFEKLHQSYDDELTQRTNLNVQLKNSIQALQDFDKGAKSRELGNQLSLVSQAKSFRDTYGYLPNNTPGIVAEAIDNPAILKEQQRQKAQEDFTLAADTADNQAIKEIEERQKLQDAITSNSKAVDENTKKFNELRESLIKTIEDANSKLNPAYANAPAVSAAYTANPETPEPGVAPIGGGLKFATSAQVSDVADFGADQSIYGASDDSTYQAQINPQKRLQRAAAVQSGYTNTINKAVGEFPAMAIEALRNQGVDINLAQTEDVTPGGVAVKSAPGSTEAYFSRPSWKGALGIGSESENKIYTGTSGASNADTLQHEIFHALDKDVFGSNGQSFTDSKNFQAAYQKDLAGISKMNLSPDQLEDIAYLLPFKTTKQLAGKMDKSKFSKDFTDYLNNPLSGLMDDTKASSEEAFADKGSVLVGGAEGVNRQEFNPESDKFLPGLFSNIGALTSTKLKQYGTRTGAKLNINRDVSNLLDIANPYQGQVNPNKLSQADKDTVLGIFNDPLASSQFAFPDETYNSLSQVTSTSKGHVGEAIPGFYASDNFQQLGQDYLNRTSFSTQQYDSKGSKINGFFASPDDLGTGDFGSGDKETNDLLKQIAASSKDGSIIEKSTEKGMRAALQTEFA